MESKIRVYEIFRSSSSPEIPGTHKSYRLTKSCDAGCPGAPGDILTIKKINLRFNKNIIPGLSTFNIPN